MPRLAACTVTAAVALAVLGMPGVALAGGPDAAGTRGPAAVPGPVSEAPGRGVAAAVRATATPTPAPAAAQQFVGPRATDVVAVPKSRRPERAARPAKAAPSTRPAQAVQPAKAGKPVQAGKPGQAGKPAKPANPAKPAAGTAAATAAAPPKVDPRGNNGTFTVDGPVLDTSHGNEPHVSCEFRLNLFGYDAGQLARIAFTAVAPTRGATTRIDGLPLISTSTAKGGQYDGSYPTAGSLSAADLGLDPTVAHHVKVRVESVNADGTEVPGGAKSKVFWLEPCAAARPAAVASEESAPVVAPRAVVPAAAPIAGQPAAAVLAEKASVQTASAQTVSARAAAPVTVLAIPELVVPQGSAQPTQLPFTGSPQVLLLLMLGAVTLAGGSALLVAVRRTP